MTGNLTNLPPKISEYLKGVSSIKAHPPAVLNIGAVAGANLAQLNQAFKGVKETAPIDHCPLSDAEIEKDTVLETLKIQKMPDIKEIGKGVQEDALLTVAGNFLGAGLITGGEGEFALSGMQELPSYRVWEWALDDISKTAPSEAIEEMREGIQQLKEYSEDVKELSETPELDEAKLRAKALKYASRIHLLGVGESQVCSSAWVNEKDKSRSSMVCEFTRNEDKTFDVYLYTSSDYQLTDLSLIGDKQRRKPVVRYSGVPEHLICFNKDGVVRPEFIQHLMEIEVLSKTLKGRRTMTEEDLLEVFDHLKNYETKVSSEEFGAITGLRAGSSIVSSTKVWARRRCGSLARYKQAMIHVDFRVMVALYRSLKVEMGADTERGDLTRRLLTQVARNFLRKIAKGVGEQGIIDHELARTAQATAYHLLKEVATHKKAIEENRRTGKVAADLAGIDHIEQRNRRIKTQNGMKTASLSPGAGAKVSVFPRIDPIINSFADLKNTVEAITKFSRENGPYVDNAYLALSVQIHRLVDQLPIPQPDPGGTGWIKNDFWKGCSSKEKEECLTQLTNLAEMYGRISSADSPSRCQATVLALHAMIHYLAVDLDEEKRRLVGGDEKNSLKSFKIAEFGDLANDLEGLIYFNRKEYDRAQEATRYFKAFNAAATSDPLFSSDKNGNINVGDYTVADAPSHGVLWKVLVERDPALRLAVDQAGQSNMELRHLTPEQIQQIYDQEYAQYLKDLSDYKAWKIYDTHQTLERMYTEGLSTTKPTPWSGFPPSRRITYEPNPPIPRVNLTDETRRTLVLESDVSPKGVLTTSGYGYIVQLRRMTNRVNQWMKSAQDYNGMVVTPKRKSIYSKEAEVEKHSTPVLDQADHLKRSVRRQYRRKDGAYERFLELDVSKRKNLSPKGRAEPVALERSSKAITLLERLERISSEWKLTPYQLILECSENLEELRNPSLQALFFELFFRSPVGADGKVHLGAGEMITQDQSLLMNCQQFITTGLSYFLKFRDKEGINGARFFLELSFYLSKYLQDAGMGEKSQKLVQIPFIEDWLEKAEVKDEHASVLHFYRLLFYSLKDPNTFTDEELIKSYQSWITYHIHPDNDTWSSPMLLALEKKTVTVLTEKISVKLQNDKDFRNKLGKGIIEALNLGHAPGTGWDHNGNLITAKYGVDDHWTIDLIGGRVYSKAGAVSNARGYRPWESRPPFLRLFGEDTDFSYNALGGDNYTFLHPEWGSPFRIVSNAIIQRQFNLFNGGELWFQYSHPHGRDGESSGFPSLLDADHSYWIAPKPIDVNGISLTGFFASLEDQKLQYATTADGRVIKVSEIGLPIQPIIVVDYLDKKDEKVAGFKRIEEADHILCFRNQNDVIQKISYPRYNSQEGSPLQFISQKGKMVWSENKIYALPEEMPEGYLGKIPNYLYLESQDKKESDKLVVPFQHVISRQIPVQQGRLEIERETPLIGSPKEWGPTEQSGLYQYFVFNIVNGKVKATTPESQLYLAYLNFSQLNYGKAIKLLRTMKLNQPLSPIGEEILKLMIKMPLKEDHPDAVMVSLHAHSLLISKLDKASKKPIENYLGDQPAIWEMAKRFQSALQSLNNISLECRLKPDEESVLIQKILHELDPYEWTLKNKDPTAPWDKVNASLKHRLKYLSGSERKEVKVKTGSRTLPNKYDSGRFRGYYGKDLDFNLPYKWSKPDVAFLKSYGYSDTTIAERVKSYNDDMDYFRRNLPDRIGWLKEGSFSLLSSYPSSPIKKNGKLLVEVVKKAKTGDLEERRAMLYRLQQWRIHTKDTLGEDDRPTIDLLIAILVEPTNYPAPIADNASLEDGYEFLKKIEEEYKKHKPSEGDIKNMLNPEAPRAPTSLPTGLYPIPERSSFDPRQQTVKEIAPKPEPIVIDLEEDRKRWNTLEGWKSSYLEEGGKFMTSTAPDFELAYVESLLSMEEEDFRKSLADDLFKLKQDYEAGRKQNLEEIQWAVDNAKAQELNQKATDEKKKVEEEIAKRKEELLKQVNLYSDDPKLREEQLAKIGGGAAREATYEDCVEKLLSMDFREYKLLNPLLQKEDVVKIAESTMQIEDLKSYEAQLDRIIDLSKKIKDIGDVNDPTRRYHCQQLNINLEARYHFENFDPTTQVILRVFSGETGILPYDKQTKLIKAMMKLDKEHPERFRDIVIQLIMGGGKTSVLATIILYLSAKREGRLALFIVPAPLFQTVEANISESMKKAFGKDVQALDVGREDLTLHRLQLIETQLKQAKARSEPIVAKASTLQCFELELLSKARQLTKALEKKIMYAKKLQEVRKQELDLRNEIAKIKNQGTAEYIKKKGKLTQIAGQIQQLEEAVISKRHELRENRDKVQLLGKICKQFPTTADALLDEVDMLLDCLQEVNFPDGERIPIDSVTNGVIHRAFQALVDPNLKVNTLKDAPSIIDVVQLHKNQQSLMDPLVFKAHVAPVVASELMKFKQIESNLSGFDDSFVRYASGKIPDAMQKFADEGIPVTEAALTEELSKDWKRYGTLTDLENDVAFLKHMEELSQGTAKERESADMMALANHLLCDLLPATLGKSGMRDYGPTPKQDKSTVIPFLAVGTPAKTQFGYDLEEACYNYQCAASFPVEEKDVRNMAATAERAARYYVEKNGEVYEETVEYKEFERLFGVSLKEIKDPANVEKAVAFISKDINKKLDLQYEHVSQNVMFRSERLSSNGMNLVDQLDSRRTMSGTPWNVQGYDRKLFERFKADEGTEGRILHALAMRAQPGGKSLHEVGFSTVKEFMDQTLAKHPKKDKVRGIIEAGGIFKIFKDNEEVAKNLMLYIQEKQEDGTLDNSIEGVLFFHKDPGEDAANTLYVWKRGADSPERIGGTSKEVLKGKGFNSSNSFVYYDESHTTGVDILQDPEAINFFTFDIKMIRRTVGQGIMRLRQFLFSQNAEIVVTKETRPMLVGKGEETEHFVISAEKTQSIRKTKDMVRYYKQQIDALFRRHVVKEIINEAAELKDTNEEIFAEKVEKNEPFYVTTIKREHYNMFGRLKRRLNTKEMLLDYLDKRLISFEKMGFDPAIMEAVRIDVGLLSEHIKKTDSLPEKWAEISAQIGVEQEVEVQTQVQLQAEVTVMREIEEEVDLELKRYEAETYGPLRDDQKLSQADLFGLIDMIKSKKPTEDKVLSLRTQLERYDYGLLEDKVPYHEAFSPNIHGTLPYFFSCKDKKVLPVFHKMQRPPKQILAIKVEGEMHWVLLSEHEANSVRTHLLDLYKKEDPRVEGVWLVQPDGSPLASSDKTEVFPSGDPSVREGMLQINAFAGNADYLDKHQNDLESWLNDNSDLKIQFLKLRTARDTRKNEVLRGIPQIQKLEKTVSAVSPAGHVFRLRAEKERSNQGKLKFNELETKLVHRALVKDLNIECVKFLGIDWEKRDSDPITQEALRRLEEKIPVEDFPLNSDARTNELKRRVEVQNQEQFANLLDFQIPSLTATQVQKWLPPKLVPFLEDPNQICIREEGKAPIYCLSDAQVRELKDYQGRLIAHVNPELYGTFSESWQIKEVAVEHIDKISSVNPSNLKLLNRKQMKGLSADQVKLLTGLSDAKKLTIPPARYGWLHGSHLELIPEQFLGYVVTEQIEEITDPKIIKNLEVIALRNKSEGHPVHPGTWTSWIKPDMVPSIDFDTQLKYLKRRDQIGRVPFDQVKKLDPSTQVPLIEAQQVQFLEGEPQIQACPFSLVPQLTKAQMPFISLAQVPYLRGEQVQGLNKPEQIKALTAVTSMEKQTVNQMQWISVAQLEHLEKEHIQGLSNLQLVQLRKKVSPERWLELRDGLKEAQVKTFDSQELIDLLSEQQITDWLERQQLPFLKTVPQVQACPDALLNLMVSEQIALVSSRQIPLLTFQRVAMVTQAGCEHLVDTQMQWISDPQIAWLRPKHVKGLSVPQLLKLRALKDQEGWKEFQSEITVGQIALFDTQATINLLNRDQIHAHLSKDQVQFLIAPWQIQACPDTLVDTISELQFKHLLPEQMPFISATQVPWVQPAQVSGLMPSRLLALRKLKDQDEWKPFQANIVQGQVDRFDSQELIDLLTGKQIKDFLSRDDQVPFLIQKWQIRGCPDGLVKSLDPDSQVPLIAPEQAPFLEGEDQVEACPAKKKWVQKLAKQHFIHLTAAQTPHLLDTQIQKMDLVGEFKKLSADQLALVNPDMVERFDDPLVRKIEQSEQAYPLAGRVKPSQLHLFTKKVVLKKHVTAEQIKGVSAAQMKDVSRGHPLWGRITPETIHDLDDKSIKKLPGKQLKHLENKAQIRSINFWKVKHLTRDQLKVRSWGQFLAYTVGVTLLGIVSTIAAMIAYISTIPFLVLLANRKKGKYVIKQINTNPKRLYRYLKVYATAPKKAEGGDGDAAQT